MPQTKKFPQLPRLVAIVGPTASGKTELGIALAQHIDGAVVSADSRQVYAGMNIGTGKPREAWREEAHEVLNADIVSDIPHYLFNIRSPNTPLMLAEWQSAAFTTIDSIIADGKMPLLVGGTMLYIDSVAKNFTIPAVQPNQQLRAHLEREATSFLYHELLAHDSAARAFIEPHHRRRIIRALEVIKATGKTFSQQRDAGPQRYHVITIGLFPNWQELRLRIRVRAENMVAGGLLEETRALIERYSSTLSLLSTMNYIQAHKVLNGKISHTQAVEEMVRVNMRYAHRQMSWWRGRENITWLNGSENLESVLRSLDV